MRLDSIKAPVGYRHHRRDHFVLTSLKRQVRRHQRTERRKRVEERFGNQTVRLNNSGTFSIKRGVNRSRIFDWIEMTLAFRGLPHLVVFRRKNRFDPGHNFVDLWSWDLGFCAWYLVLSALGQGTFGLTTAAIMLGDVNESAVGGAPLILPELSARVMRLVNPKTVSTVSRRRPLLKYQIVNRHA